MSVRVGGGRWGSGCGAHPTSPPPASSAGSRLKCIKDKLLPIAGTALVAALLIAVIALAGRRGGLQWGSMCGAGWIWGLQWGSMCGAPGMWGLQWGSVWGCMDVGPPMGVSVGLWGCGASNGGQCGAGWIWGLQWGSVWGCGDLGPPMGVSVGLWGPQCGSLHGAPWLWGSPAPLVSPLPSPRVSSQPTDAPPAPPAPPPPPAPRVAPRPGSRSARAASTSWRRRRSGTEGGASVRRTERNWPQCRAGRSW